jgi:hypothetical protein
MKPQPKPQTRFELTTEQRRRLAEMAREELGRSSGMRRAAIERFARRIEDDPALLKSVLLAAADELAERFVGGNIRTERTKLFVAASREIEAHVYVAPVKGPISTPKTSVKQIGEAVRSSLLDLPLDSGLLLRLATKTQVFEFGKNLEAHGTTTLKRARFFLSICDHVPSGGALVGDHVDEATALRLWKEAA